MNGWIVHLAKPVGRIHRRMNIWLRTSCAILVPIARDINNIFIYARGITIFCSIGMIVHCIVVVVPSLQRNVEGVGEQDGGDDLLILNRFPVSSSALTLTKVSFQLLTSVWFQGQLKRFVSRASSVPNIYPQRFSHSNTPWNRTFKAWLANYSTFNYFSKIPDKKIKKNQFYVLIRRICLIWINSRSSKVRINPSPVCTLLRHLAPRAVGHEIHYIKMCTLRRANRVLMITFDRWWHLIF